MTFFSKGAAHEKQELARWLWDHAHAAHARATVGDVLYIRARWFFPGITCVGRLGGCIR
jgi:hypothetical protein